MIQMSKNTVETLADPELKRCEVAETGDDEYLIEVTVARAR